MSVSTKALIGSAVSLVGCILLGLVVYQQEFRGWTIFWFVAGGLALASFSTLVVWLSAQTQTEIQDQQKKNAGGRAGRIGRHFLHGQSQHGKAR